MSLEQDIQSLTQALNANTQALLGNGGMGSAPTTGQQANTQNSAQSAAPAPAQNAVVQNTQNAAVQNAVGYPSNQGAPAQQQGAPAPQQGAPAQQQGAPAPQQGAPAQQQGAPAQQQQQQQQQGAVSFDQLQQEVTAIYQRLAGDARIGDIVTRYGGALSTIAPEQYSNILGELRALG